MSHGTSKIIKKSVLSPELRDVFLTAKHFVEKPRLLNLEEWTNYFDPSEPKTEIEHAILKLLELEEFDASDKIIEYWFQHQLPGQYLAPHCDYNHIIREKLVEADSNWILTADKKNIMSPVTVGCYLKIGNTTGGELCISDKDWFDDQNPLYHTGDQLDIIRNYPYETFMPRDDDIIYFEGSKYFHWINPVIEGERKSMMINFWPKDLILDEE